ncbi:hypothetical protein, partial [Rhodopseudomonas infernalis]|uniref:hypothetical protein n=1 Tax=Rhodopseudomonas infernalis TaxID=2897386 RepID=UPI001EE92012
SSDSHRHRHSLRKGHGVTLKRVSAEVFRPAPIFKAEAPNTETRKDSAVHVSLSSSSLVKQPEVKRPLHP